MDSRRSRPDRLAAICLTVLSLVILTGCQTTIDEVETACAEKWNRDPGLAVESDRERAFMEPLPVLRGDTDYESCAIWFIDSDGSCRSKWAPVDEVWWNVSACDGSPEGGPGIVEYSLSGTGHSPNGRLRAAEMRFQGLLRSCESDGFYVAGQVNECAGAWSEHIN